MTTRRIDSALCPKHGHTGGKNLWSGRRDATTFYTGSGGEVSFLMRPMNWTLADQAFATDFNWSLEISIELIGRWRD